MPTPAIKKIIHQRNRIPVACVIMANYISYSVGSMAFCAKSGMAHRRAAVHAIVMLLVSVLGAFAAPDDSKNKRNPEAVGARKVDGGINFYSVEKEIALGKQLAIEVGRQAKLFEDPITNEY